NTDISLIDFIGKFFNKFIDNKEDYEVQSVLEDVYGLLYKIMLIDEEYLTKFINLIESNIVYFIQYSLNILQDERNIYDKNTITYIKDILLFLNKSTPLVERIKGLDNQRSIHVMNQLKTHGIVTIQNEFKEELEHIFSNGSAKDIFNAIRKSYLKDLSHNELKEVFNLINFDNIVSGEIRTIFPVLRNLIQMDHPNAKDVLIQELKKYFSLGEIENITYLVMGDYSAKEGYLSDLKPEELKEVINELDFSKLIQNDIRKYIRILLRLDQLGITKAEEVMMECVEKIFNSPNYEDMAFLIVNGYLKKDFKPYLVWYANKRRTLFNECKKAASYRKLDFVLNWLPENESNAIAIINSKIGKLNVIFDEEKDRWNRDKCYITFNQDGELTKFTIYETSISEIPDDIGFFKKLRIFQIGKAHLKAIPNTIGNLTMLEHLWLYDNDLQSIPEEVGNLRNLKEINLRNNQLTSIPDSIGKIIGLKRLELGGNKLNSLPETIGNCRSLERLDLGNNELNNLPSTISNLTKLHSLNLENNNLDELPGSIGNLYSLSYLNLKKNNLTTLPSSIGRLKSLSTLNLWANKISSLPDVFGNLTNLYEVKLWGNPIKEGPPSFKKLKKKKNRYWL
ncbi:MAG: leucine-rich repeat domain-containing protein, partial [Candidatus Helarchaeota archaeon]